MVADRAELEALDAMLVDAPPSGVVEDTVPTVGGHTATPQAFGERLLPDPRSAIRKGKRTEDGWLYFETPLADDHEFWSGNPKATVTVVKYADFECSYCRYLSKTLHPIQEKYKDRVRFVMKHFPMNYKCNRTMRGYDKHPRACEAAYAGHCAGLQGKFWEMHDLLYDNQDDLSDEALRGYGQQLGLSGSDFSACLIDPQTEAAIRNDVEIALRAGINGTPRTYVNNRIITGSASRSILEYHIERALKNPGGSGVTPESVAQGPAPDGRQMIEVKGTGGTFFIDPYEAAITLEGKGISVPAIEPARVSWYGAKEACEKAGKRLCSEEEWVSACAGTAAIDNNKNGFFGDDTVEGNMYPYGPFYESGHCHDQGDKYEGRALASGTRAKCRTARGVYDLAGNISEWVGEDEKQSALMGGHSASGERAACNQRSASSGAGRRNHTTGFRCCADGNVKTASLPDKDDIKPHPEVNVGQPTPAFSAEASDGKKIQSRDFMGKVTLINFFASWCGPCKKEFPYLVKHQRDLAARGFQVIGIGADSAPGKSVEFAEGYGANFPIISDTTSRLMGEFGVFSMPATFLVDRQGVIRYKDTGFKPEEQAAPLKRAIDGLL